MMPFIRIKIYRYMSLIRNINYYRAETLGEGSFGSVTTVYDDDGGTFALKTFLEDPDNDTTHYEIVDGDYTYVVNVGECPPPDYELGMLREISILRLTNHPNIIKLFDVSLNQGRFAMVMPKLNGDLYQAISDGYLSPKQKLGVAHGLISAVAYLHENGIIHRDIKPDNVLLDADCVPVLADFSLAKPLHVAALEPAVMTPSVGTTSYMAPEVVDMWPYGLAADVWSVGVVLLELFGKLLDTNKNLETIKKIRSLTVKLIDKPVPNLIKSLLQINPANRASCSYALNLPLFDKYPRISYERIRLSSSNDGVSITQYAANEYARVSGVDIASCKILASKMYDSDLVDLWVVRSDDNMFNIPLYLQDEYKIFSSMGFSLFV